jgi:hypothetical protein
VKITQSSDAAVGVDDATLPADLINTVQAAI